MKKLPILQQALAQFVNKADGDVIRAMLEQPANYWNVTKPQRDGIPDYRQIAIMLNYSPMAQQMLLSYEEAVQWHDLTVKARSKFIELKHKQNDTGRKLLQILQDNT